MTAALPSTAASDTALPKAWRWAAYAARARDPERAIGLARKAIDLDARNHAAWNDLALLLKKRNNSRIVED